MKLLRSISFSSLLCFSLFSAPSFADGQLVFEQPRVKAPFPGRMMSAAYMDISNPTDSDKIMVSASAPWSGLIEIHTHAVVDGVMRMRHLEELVIPAGETVNFKPGGLHLMLFKLKKPLAESLPMEVCFKDGTCQEVEAQLFYPD